MLCLQFVRVLATAAPQHPAALACAPRVGLKVTIDGGFYQQIPIAGAAQFANAGGCGAPPPCGISRGAACAAL